MPEGGLGTLYQNQILLHDRVGQVEDCLAAAKGRIDSIDK